MKNAVFWDVTPCGSCKNRVLRFLVAAIVISSSPILVNLLMETTRSYRASAFTTATSRNIPEDGILQISSRYHC
jgi:hypothetical protein